MTRLVNLDRFVKGFFCGSKRVVLLNLLNVKIACDNLIEFMNRKKAERNFLFVGLLSIEDEKETFPPIP
jgi:hypothetical protein